MIQDVVNVKIVWIVRDGPQDAVQSMPTTLGVKASSIAHAGISNQKQWPIEVSLHINWTFWQFQKTSSGREDLTATDMANFQEVENIIWPTTWKGDAKRKTLKESMTDSCEMTFSVDEWLRPIEMQKRLSCMGRSCKWRSHLSCVTKRILLLQEQLVASISISRAMTPNHSESVLI